LRLSVHNNEEAPIPDPPAHDMLYRHNQGLRAWLADAISHGIAEGTMKQEMPVSQTIATSIAVLDGLQQQWVQEPDSVPMTSSVRGYVRGLKTLGGVGPASLGNLLTYPNPCRTRITVERHAERRVWSRWPSRTHFTHRAPRACGPRA